MNVTYKQREILLDSLKQHPEIIRGRVSRKSESRKELKDIWEQITNKLNSSGEGPVKTVQEWIKSWSDWKTYVLKKKTNRRRNVQGTGGGPPKIVNFTDLEAQLLEILTPEAAGLANIPQAGFKSKKGTEIPYPEVPEVLEVPERSVQNEIMDDFEVLDIDKVPIIYCDDDLGNSTTRTQSGYTFEEDEDKENVNCKPKNKKRKAGLLQNSFSEIVNCSDPSSTTAGSYNNRSTKYGLSDKKKVKVDCSYNETEQVKKKNEKQPVALLFEIAFYKMKVTKVRVKSSHETCHGNIRYSMDLSRLAFLKL
ncbi:uncharacterized protein LOC143903377 [Temnothorax americanus]|uniref:uncharacterized protein LOC143903377 n=1 Tax=Temnothorax americanus TaxID=1964332 RepID=UPI004068CCFA